MGVAIGVDSHKSSLGTSAVDELGRTIAAREFSNAPEAYPKVHDWIASHGDDRVVGIEGAGHYGSGLAQFLLARGEDVKEVPAFVTHRARKRAPAKGKSDLADAVAIAQATARGEHVVEIARDGVALDLKLLSDRRDQLVRARTRIANQIHADLSILAPGYEKKIPNLGAKKHLAAVLLLVAGDASVRADLVRDRVDELCDLDRRIVKVTHGIADKVDASGTMLTAIKGIGSVLAAKVIGEAGDIKRFRSKASFAMFSGTAPLEASSGKTKRHRLNRGGNRQLNQALHMIAVSRCRCDADTKAYVARQRLRGQTKRETMRSLKRHLSNVVYRHLLEDANHLRRAA